MENFQLSKYPLNLDMAAVIKTLVVGAVAWVVVRASDSGARGRGFDPH